MVPWSIRTRAGVLAVVVVSAMLLQAAPFGAGQQNQSDLAFITELATLRLGPLEGQAGFSTNQDDDGGYVVVDRDRWDGSFGHVVETDLANRTQPGPGIYKSTDGGQAWAKRSFRFFALVDRTQASVAGVFFADSTAGPVDPATAELAVAFDGRMVKLTSGRAKDVHSYPVIMTSDSEWAQFDVDFRGDGDVDVCIRTAPSSQVQESISLNFAQVKLTPDGERPPRVNLDTVGLFVGGELDRASTPRWGDILASARGRDLDLCRGSFDAFERYAVGSDLNGQGGWTTGSRDPSPFGILEEDRAGGGTNRFVGQAPDPVPGSKLFVGNLAWDTGPNATNSAGARLRSDRADQASAGLVLGNGTGVELAMFLDAHGKVVLVGPDGSRTRLSGTYAPGVAQELTVTRFSYDVNSHVDTFACAEGLTSDERKWAAVGDPVPKGDHPDFIWLPTTVSLSHRGPAGGNAEPGWDDVLVAPGLGLCDVERERFDGLAPGELVGQGGWSGAGGMKELVGYLLDNNLVEDEHGTEPAFRSVTRAKVLSVGLSMAGSDASQRSAGFYLADARRGTDRADALLDLRLGAGGTVEAQGDGTTGTHEVGHWLGLYHTSQPSADAFFDVFVDLDLPSGRAEVCVRDPELAPGVQTYETKVLVFEVRDLEAQVDTLALDPGPDAGRTSVAAWDNIIYGAGDGDLCPTPPTLTATLDGTQGEAGWYRSAVTLTLACADAATGETVERVKVKFPWLPGPATGTGPHTIAEEGASVVEPLCEAKPGYWTALPTTVKVDTVPPATSMAFGGLAGNNGWFRSGGQLTFRCVDEASHCARVVVEVDGVQETHGSSPDIIIWDIKDGFVDTAGTHTVTRYSYDTAGNVEPPETETVRIDPEPPVTAVALDGPRGDNGWFLGPVDVTMTCTDATSGPALLSWSVDGGPVQTAREGFPEIAGNFRETAEGETPVEVWCEDVAGNPSLKAGFVVKIDSEPPELVLTQPVEGSLHVLDTVHLNPMRRLPVTLVVGDLTVKADASDATSGVARVEFRVDGQLRATDTDAPYAWRWDTALGDVGSHELGVVARDAAGNTTSEGLFVFVVGGPPS